MKGPNILFVDIETSPMEGYFWQPVVEYIPKDMVTKDRQILSWAAKFKGKPMIYKSQAGKKVLNDKSIMAPLWDLIDQADIVVGQNSKRFDVPIIQGRFVYHKLPPTSSFKQVDTLKLAKRHFGLPFYNLEYLAEYLGVKYRKLVKRKFNGFALWKECLAGNEKAWAEMKRYNIRDVQVLEAVYDRLIPWDTTINFLVYNGECSCGSKDFKKDGHFYGKTGKNQRFKCTQCGKPYQASKTIKTTDKK